MEPSNPVIICGSGSLLHEVPFRLPGYPLAAISTAIRLVPEPDFWLLTDRVKEDHGAAGLKALANPKVMKVVPADRDLAYRGVPNVTMVRRFQPGDRGRAFLDGKKGVLTGNCNRSMLFAVQWLSGRFDTLIFAGVDMQVEDLKKPWGHDFFPPHRTKHRQNHVDGMKRGLNEEFRLLKQWTPLALDKGVRWLSWSPGSRIEEIMESYTWMPIKSPSNSES